MNHKPIILFFSAILTTTSINAASSLPYYNDCSDLSTVTVLSESTASASKWQCSTYSNNYVFRCKPASGDVNRVGTATLWTPALEIEDGKLYKISLVWGVNSVTETSKGQIAMYTSPDINAAQTVIAEVSPMISFTTSARPDAYTAYFVGDSSKPYIGIGSRGGGAYVYFVVDDIRVEESTDPIPPSPAQNLAVSAVGKDLTIKFNVPEQNIMGMPLSADGIEKAVILRDNKLIASFSNPVPGAEIIYYDSVSTAGNYTYTVVCQSNGVESTTSATIKVYGTEEEPSLCTTYERDENGEVFGRNYYAPAVFIPGQGVRISWKAAIGDENPLYDVVRLHDGKIIASKTADIEVFDTDVDPDTPQSLQYIVKLSTGNVATDLYTSSAVSMNNPVPFTPAVSTESLYEFTVIDGDRDTYSWTAVTTGNVTAHGASKYFNSARRGDDWLITPGLRLEAGKIYRIDVDALCGAMIPSNVELQVCAGRQNNAEGMTDEIIEPIIFNHMMPQTYSAYYIPEETANYFFGFRGMDPTGNSRFDDMGISDINIYEADINTPQRISDFSVDYSSIPGIAELFFTAPSKSVSGADLASLSKIELYRDGELFKTFENPTPGAVFSTEIQFELEQLISYSVIPFCDDAAGLAAELVIMVSNPPYSNSFDTQIDATGFTIINPSLSGYTWGYMPVNQAMRCYYGSEGLNDYLIAPTFHLEAGSFYKIDFLAWLDKEDSYNDYNNQIEVLLGKAATIDGLSTQIIEPTYVRGSFGSKSLIKEWFTVPTTGEYYIAWHAMSEPGRARELYIDDVNISAKIPGTYPGGVDNLKITPDKGGALMALISFDLPVKDLSGNDLSGNFHGYKLYCDGQEISNGDGIPGEHIDFIHTTTKGVHLYTVRCFGAEDEPSRDVEDIAYIGINRPGPVPFVEVNENPDKYGEVTITWDTPETDINGFPLNTSDITYTVGEYTYNSYTGTYEEFVYANGIKAHSYTKAVKSSNSSQEFMRFFVRAVTSAGEAATTVLSRYNAVGQPFGLPFHESFSKGIPTYNMMQERPFEGKYASWGYNTENPVTGVQPVDADGGLCLMETIESGSGARLYTLRINLNVENPVMSFYIYNQSNDTRTDNNIFGVSVRVGDSDFVSVKSMTVNEWCDGNRGWQKVYADLSEFAGKVVYIGLDGIANNLTFIHIDNITIDSAPLLDVSVGTPTHSKPYLAVEHEINITVTNHGIKEASNMELSLMLDNKVLETKNIDKLSPGQSASYVFANTLGRNQIGKHTYSAEVTLDGDVDLANNVQSAAWFYLAENRFPGVENLELSANDDNTEVTLSWDEPSLPSAPTEITDDFESYPSWSTMHTGGLGDYILVDRDGCGVGGFQNVELPNVEYGSKQSFTLWDFTLEAFAHDQATSDRYKAHSGDKCLVSLFAPGVDDWTEDQLISPLLTGEAQTISFYAKALSDENYEIVQVFYSTGGTAQADFVDNRFPRVTLGGEWQKLTYDLPEGTKYFMIEHYNAGYRGYFLFIDDLTYTPVGDETLKLAGYNVYHNGSLISQAGSAREFKHNPTVNALNTYAVGALYDRGESPLAVDNINLVSDGVSDSRLNVAVEGNRGEIVISGAEGLDFSVVTASGMVLTSRRADTTVRIPAAAGVYMVYIGGNVYKVVVK